MSAMDHLRSEKGVAKNSSMTIIRLPRFERMIAGKKMKSAALVLITLVG